MSREISLFTDYHKEEDRVTNYFGLLLKMLYEESPGLFYEVVATLIDDRAFPPLLPLFEQQYKTASSRPDMCITQQDFSIWFENKTTDWFDDGQLVRHLEELKKLPGDNKNKILVLLCGEQVDEDKLLRFSENEQEIKIAQISYESIVSTIENVLKKQNYVLGNTFKSFLNEFDTYLSQYIPDWENTLDVINCSGSFPLVLDNNVYACPNTGGHYSHRRCRYFGTYKNKETKYVAEIDGIVYTHFDADSNISLEIQYDNIKNSDDLKKRAQKYLDKFDDRSWEKTNEIRMFILSDLVEVSVPFRKDSKGGLFGNKVYFSLDKEISTSEELSAYLSGKNWSDLNSGRIAHSSSA
jgi:hypothetical protein